MSSAPAPAATTPASGANPSSKRARAIAARHFARPREAPLVSVVVYCSLLKVDFIGSSPAGPICVQSDHRERSEIEATPELSVLFALIRLRKAHAVGARAAAGAPTVVYACTFDAPDLLAEAIAASGAILEVEGGDEVALPPAPSSPEDLADRAFRALADRVATRTGAADLAAVLVALETATRASPPDLSRHEVAYWTRVLELTAVTCELVRAQQGGRWVASERSDLGFGFAIPGVGVMLPSRIGTRFVAAMAEPMFHLLAERTTGHLEAPVMPSLRRRSDAIRDHLLWRALGDGGGPLDAPDVPVVAYGHDTPTAVALLTEATAVDPDAIHAAALANLEPHPVGLETVSVAGLEIVVVSDSFYAAEKLLDRAFMRTMHDRVASPTLAVSVPHRGMLFATAASPLLLARAVAVLDTLTTAASTRAARGHISTAILIVHDGEPTGVARLTPRALRDEGRAEPPRKRRFIDRLMGR